MRCPTLKELPPPPKGKTGWPWTEESIQLLDTMPDGRAWPKISIINPNYNHGQSLEEAIRSVLLQGYPNLEYILIDGGSTDNSLEIIKKYEPWIGYWVSEKDEGIYDAMNKGINIAKGEWLYFLGSDDILCSNILGKVFINKKNLSADIVYGDVILKNCKKRYLGKFNFEKLTKNNICHQAIFFRKKVFEKLGLYNNKYKILADWEFNFRWINDRGIKKRYCNEIIAIFNEQGISAKKTDSLFHKNFKEISYLSFQKLSRKEKLFYKLKQLVLNKFHRLKRLLE